MRATIGLALSWIAASIFISSHTAHAQSNFYEGKTVSLIVGNAAGGGYDVAARALAMSEDTLHRRLAGEDTSFSKLLTDVRMDHAVSLLWTTDLPVGHVAVEAGYTSASRFATRFNARFGILPSKLRTRRS